MEEDNFLSKEDPGIVLVLRQDGVLLPAYDSALSVAEGWPWEIRRVYANAILIRESGEVARVDRVTVDRPYGNSLPSKVLSVLNSNWMVTLHLVHTTSEVGDVVRAIQRGVEADRVSGRNLFDPPDGARFDRIPSSASIAEVFSKLQLGNPNFVAIDSL